MDIMHISFVLIFLSCVALSEQQCTRHGAKCLTYTVIESNENYEKRLYGPIVWASSTGKAKERAEITRTLIRRLYSYFGGQNIRGERIDMMVPFRTTKFPGQDLNTYIMSIPLAPEYQENPPKPTNPLVKIVAEPETIYFARGFGGRVSNETKFDDEVQTLRNSLEEIDVASNTSYYYWSAYDSPWTPDDDRLNEVWLTPSENSSK